MRLVFLGTAEFGVPCLSALVQAGHRVDPVVTAPVRPSGRGRRLTPSPVSLAARDRGLTVIEPDNPNAPGLVERLGAAGPDIGVLVAYGFILRPALLGVPSLGFLNVHPSLLPAYRGAAPIQRALMDGAVETGVTVITMSRQVDAGDIVAQERTAVGADETAGDLSARLALVGARLLLSALAQAESGLLPRTPQDHTRATPAPKIDKTDRVIDWSQPAASIHNRIRALSPEPGAVTAFRERRLVLLRSRLASGSADSPAGTLQRSHTGLSVCTGSGLVELVEVRPEGGRPMTGAAFANGQRLQPGEKLR